MGDIYSILTIVLTVIAVLLGIVCVLSNKRVKDLTLQREEQRNEYQRNNVELMNQFSKEKEDIISQLSTDKAQAIGQLNTKHYSDIRLLNQEHDRKIEVLNSQHEQEILDIKKSCEAQITQIKEYIEARKELLKQMSEKDLLVDVLISLDGYGSRMQRLEQSLSSTEIVEKIKQMETEIFNAVQEYIIFMKTQMGEISRSTQSSSKNLSEELNMQSDHLIKQLSRISETFKRQIHDSGIQIRNAYQSIDSKISSTSANIISSIQEIKSPTKKKSIHPRWSH